MSAPQPNSNPQPKRFSPREFLRARRPELFSDSMEEPVSELDRSLLEYHLESLTSRSQELDFELFARALCEREVCPNLLPHTGPTGGGDSKVDTETYPVADSLTLAWFAGDSRGGIERWAFAFSAMADWKKKVKSDVEKIAATERGYKKAFFVSSRYIPDRIRAEVEDTLSKRFGLDVRIFDRTWILDRVFSGHHEELAIRHLKVTALTKTRVVKGPRDAAAERARQEIEVRIKGAVATPPVNHAFVDDCIEAARLARSLNRPRVEIEGCFERARRAADEHGTNHQKLLAKYQAAWTTYWWFEDYAQFARLYGEAEKHALGTVNPHEIELLTNLWIVLHSLVAKGELDEVTAELGARTATLKVELDRLSSAVGRPSTSLLARTNRLNVDLLIEIRSRRADRINAILAELEGVIKESDGLVGFPLEPLVKIITEIGPFLGDQPAYESLFESVVTLASRRDGDATAARLLCQRGADQIEREQFYEAIRSLGRALTRLFQHETRDELVRALYLCAHAYAKVGLLWAARGTLLSAASVATNEYWTREDVTFAQAGCYHQLKWTELQLGRLPQALAWHELDMVVQAILARGCEDISRLSSEATAFDGMLGILILKADIWQLKFLSQLPAALGRMGLPGAGLALRFALGFEEEVARELSDEFSKGEQFYSFFRSWRDQPGAAQLPGTPSLYEGASVELRSRILGCQITVKCDAVSPCLELAESMLAAVEALFATGFSRGLASREPALTLQVRKADFVARPFDFALSEPQGRPHIEVRCADFHPHKLSREEQGAVKDKLFEVLATILARVFLAGDVESVCERLFGDERALERAVHFTSSFVTLGNVLGHDPKDALSAWIRGDDRNFPLQRSVKWDATEATSEPAPPLRASPAPSDMQAGSPDEFRPETIKQNDIETFSLIREALWNRAEWVGVAYYWDPGLPPMLSLAFKHVESAFQIFSSWRAEFGRHDKEERIRIVVIRGIHRSNPYAYRVLLAPNSRPGSGKIGIVVSRSITMEPASDAHLTRFLEAYRRLGGYLFAPAIQTPGDPGTAVKFEQGILKRRLEVRDAWEIGVHDPDAMGVTPEDDPIIPADQSSAPILELLSFLRSRRA